MTRLLRLLGAAAVAAFLAAACGGGDGGRDTAAPASTTTAAAPRTGAPGGGETTTGNGGEASDDSATITIKDFRYGRPVTVRPGATVTVVNQDVARHDVVADQDQLFKTDLLGQGETATFTAPTTPGTYTFSCTVHATMTGIGTLVVDG